MCLKNKIVFLKQFSKTSLGNNRLKKTLSNSYGLYYGSKYTFKTFSSYGVSFVKIWVPLKDKPCLLYFSF